MVAVASAAAVAASAAAVAAVAVAAAAAAAVEAEAEPAEASKEAAADVAAERQDASPKRRSIVEVRNRDPIILIFEFSFSIYFLQLYSVSRIGLGLVFVQFLVLGPFLFLIK